MTILPFFKFAKNKMSQDYPWGEYPSIYEYISSQLTDSGSLPENAEALPDEARRFKENDIRWVAGGMDGAFGHHCAGRNSNKLAKRVAELIQAISLKDSIDKKVELYNLLLEDNLMEFIDPALEIIVNSDTQIEPYLCEFSRWLAFQSPDRGPIKFGIALLGLMGDRISLEKIVTLGKHEEFTLFSAVALTNILENPERELWQLAQHVNGWGKIHLVEKLAETELPEIKRWLIRKGYSNSIMNEYLAYTCAVAGDLKAELSKTVVEEELLCAAGEIISALISGGPAEDISDYEDAPEVIELYVNHVNDDSMNLSEFLVLSSIKGLLEENSSESVKWREGQKSRLILSLNKRLIKDHWTRIVLENKNTQDERLFWQVDRAAIILGVSLWETHWKRLIANPIDQSMWFNVMRNANNERIDQIVEFAIQSIPLEKIATGPSDEMGFGEEFEIHNCLDFILQDLNRYPSKGFELIKAGLSSPTVRNRNMAINALKAWSRTEWPEGTSKLLKIALDQEPDSDVRDRLSKLISG